MWRKKKQCLLVKIIWTLIQGHAIVIEIEKSHDHITSISIDGRD